MRSALKIICLTVILVMLTSGIAPAQKPGTEVNPNGFPSGPHYNLNIIAKKDGYGCTPLEYDEYGNPVYGNVIFVPESGQGIQILMKSGKGKRASLIPELQVTDACTATFDGSPAALQLPKNDLGYRVYARALAKPTDSPFMEIMPDLVSVEDEYGNDLIYLGLVTSQGFETPYVKLTRKKGHSPAIPITGLFQWSGDVCYLDPSYCDSNCVSKVLCCTDANGDGIYESCTPLAEGETCPIDSMTVTASCRTYSEEWVFNIGDFVTYLWNLDNSGLKLLQVRFYPVTQ